jgi:hypothetical protein
MNNQHDAKINSGTNMSSFVKISVVVAIVIVSNLFFNYSASLIFNEPVNDVYINSSQVVEPILSRDECISVGGQWNSYLGMDVLGKKEMQGSCFAEYSKQKAYDEAMKIFNRNVFIFLVVVGVALIAASSFVSISLLSISIAWSGILSLLVASMRYWSDADTWAKLIILGLALCLLVWVIIKRFNK